MHEFAEEYVANLKPKEERYDSRLGDDFYVSTFPNGVKTWIYLYKVGDHTRRRTLGIYPEMPLPDALEALYTARRTLAVELELMEKGLDGSKVVRNREATPKPPREAIAARVGRSMPDRRFWVGTLVGLAVGAVAGLGVFYALGERAPAPVAAAVALPETTVETESTPTAPADTVAPEQSGAPPPDTVVADAGSDAPPADVAAEVDEAVTEPEPEPVPDVAAPVAEPADEVNRELIALQRDLAGTVAWSQLTSDVVDGEPVDQLGWIIDVREPRRVFYFVRVRGMADEMVTYSWFYEDELVREDAVRLGSGWHSPAYSGITLTPDRAGRWRVEIATERGPLGSEEFELRAAATG